MAYLLEDEAIPLNVPIPFKAWEVMKEPSRYKILWGGRGGAKSHTFAKTIDAKASQTVPLRILCTREMQNSIRDSVHKLLVDTIYAMNLGPYFQIGKESIKSIYGSEIIFRGMHNNISEIKSMEGIDIVWVEEAEKVSKQSWEVLIPTIRKKGSEIWVSFNPEEENSATYNRFIINPPPDCRSAKLSWRDLGPHFPEVLMREMEYCRKVDYEAYLHIWEGMTKKYGDSLVLKGKFFVEEFETPEDVTLLYGLDFGFSVSPTALIRGFIKDRCLYIDYDAGGLGIEIDALPDLMRAMPGADTWPVRADNSRPDTISYLNKNGFANVIPCVKGKDSIKDGIQFLRHFERIVIHPRCVGTLGDCQNYRWKVDKNTGLILPVPVDAWNDYIDALRYALEDYMSQNVSILDCV